MNSDFCWIPNKFVQFCYLLNHYLCSLWCCYKSVCTIRIKSETTQGNRFYFILNWLSFGEQDKWKRLYNMAMLKNYPAFYRNCFDIQVFLSNSDLSITILPVLKQHSDSILIMKGCLVSHQCLQVLFLYIILQQLKIFPFESF